VSNLLQIPIYFDLEIYVASRQEKVCVYIVCRNSCHADHLCCLRIASMWNLISVVKILTLTVMNLCAIIQYEN